MPKSRRTKAKHQDFQKVKLKAGRSLPKALNETKTAFKSQSIQIREQLAQDTSQPTTRRKLNIKDLLGQCQHYSSSVRHDALSGLRELITASPEILAVHIAMILERTSALCLDKDGTLRQALCRFYKLILPQISADQMKPFFALLSAHLSCAMTHIQDDIRLDSLQLLDLCLDNYPALVAEQQGTLLPNFIQQISRPSGGNAKNRTLLVNPSSKISGQRWQMLVLQRLEKFLSAVIGHSQGTSPSQSSTNPDGMDTDCGPNTQYNIVKYHDHRPTEILILRETRRGPGLRLWADASRTELSVSKESCLHDYMVTLVPLLLQCWVEVGPSQLATDLPGNVLSKDAMSTLSSILGILELLISGVKQHGEEDKLTLLREKYRADFQQYFMAFFPYSMHEPPVKAKAKAKDTPQVTVLSLNLAVCDVMSQFLNAGNWGTSTFGAVIVEYVVQALQNVKLSPTQTQTVLRVMRRLLDLPLDEETQCDLLKAVRKMYQEQHIMSAEKSRILMFFVELVLDPRRKDLLNIHPVQQWLRQLPRQLNVTCSQNPSAVAPLLDALLRLSVLSHGAFVKSLQDSSVQILQDCFPRIPSPQVQVSLFDLLFRISKWTENHFRAVACLCHQGNVSPLAFRRFLQIIMHHLTRCMVSSEDLPFHVQDVFSLIIAVSKGFPTDDLNKLRDVQASTPDVGVSTSFLWDPAAMTQRWKYHGEIVQEVVGVLQQFPNGQQAAHVYATYLQTWLSAPTVLPLQSVYGITQCLQAFGDMYHPTNQLQGLVSMLLLRTLQVLPQMVSRIKTDNVQEGNSEDTTDINLISSDVVGSAAGLLSTWSLEGPLTSGEARMFLENTFQELSKEDLQDFVEMLGQLLTHPLLKHTATLYKARLKPIVESTQLKISNLNNQKWWINFAYELSI